MLFKVFFKITVTVLKNKVEFLITRYDFFQIDDVGMFEYFKERDFPDCGGWYSLILMIQSDFFNGHYLISLLISRFIHDAISSLTNFIDTLELVCFGLLLRR